MRKIKTMKTVMTAVFAAATLVLPAASAKGQAPVISSFGRNGELVCTNLFAGSTASVVWASSLLGPWTNSTPGLDVVRVDTNGAIRVSLPVLSWSVPFYCRVRGVPAPVGMALIPAGPFTMGNCLAPSEGERRELPLHTNQISGFYMDKYEVTKALWDEVRAWANINGYDLGTIGAGMATNHPVQRVSWYDVVKWCNARSEREGRVPAYYTSAAQTSVYRTGSVDLQSSWVKWTNGYRLPTEAEWEKAARGGVSGQRFPWSDTNTITHSQANYYSDARFTYDTSPTRGFHPSFQAGGWPYTSPAGYFAPNGYGLYDMAGNVWEWVWDWWGGDYTVLPATNPRGPTSGTRRAIRGGSWHEMAYYCWAADRFYDSFPADRYDIIGFRSVLPTSQP